MKRIAYLIIVFVSGVQTAYSQAPGNWQVASKEEVVTAYKKIWDWFVNTDSYQFQLKYTSFKDHSRNEVVESSEGYYKRAGLKYKTECVGVKTIQTEKVKIIVDTADKIIALTNPGTLSPNIPEAKELVKLLENVKALKKRNIGSSIQYRIEFRKNDQYEAYEFMANENGLLEKLIYYYSEQTEKDYGNGDDEAAVEWKIKPRLEIQFNNYVAPLKNTATDFTESAIVFAGDRKVSLVGKYKGFGIKDYRFDKK